jgi:toxin ParE1/3/4
LNYRVIRTDTADAGIRQIMLFIAEKFGNEVALEKLDELEHDIMLLGSNPYIGTEPKYPVLKRQGYKVFISGKNLVFYKVNDDAREVIIYAVVDQRQDYMNILRGL